jgi:hypothetical protein
VSVCTRTVCPHERGVFIWLGDGPEADGTYPWVHDTSTSPGHLEVCEMMAFATAEEAGEEPAVAAPEGPLASPAPSEQPVQLELFAVPAPADAGSPHGRRRVDHMTPVPAHVPWVETVEVAGGIL